MSGGTCFKAIPKRVPLNINQLTKLKYDHNSNKILEVTTLVYRDYDGQQVFQVSKKYLLGLNK